MIKLKTNSSLYDLNEAIKDWEGLVSKSMGNTLIYIIGHLWWKKKYTAEDMLLEAKDDSEVWKDYVLVVTMQISFNSY